MWWGKKPWVWCSWTRRRVIREGFTLQRGKQFWPFRPPLPYASEMESSMAWERSDAWGRGNRGGWTSSSVLGHPLHNCHKGVVLSDSLEASAGTECNGHGAFKHLLVCTYSITLVLAELQWFPVCLWAQFKVLVLAYTSLYGLGLEYLKPSFLTYFLCLHL